jgi:hypothetical protein
MADNEIKYSGLGDLRTAEALAARFVLLLAERGIIIDHPALMYAGNISGRGSAVLKVPQIGLMGYDLLAVDTSENTNTDETALTDGSGTVTVQRYVKVYTPTDLARMTSPYGELDQNSLAMDAFASAQVTITSLIMNLLDNFANTSGASGVDMDLATWIATQAALEARNVDGDYMAGMHSSGWSHLREEIALVQGGTVTWDPANADMVNRTGRAYRGRLLGSDLFVSNFVPASGGDRVGGMFGFGALAWADGTPPVDDPVTQRLLGGGVLFERDRVPRKGETDFVSSMYYGVSEQIDDAGQTFTHLGS